MSMNIYNEYVCIYMYTSVYKEYVYICIHTLKV